MSYITIWLKADGTCLLERWTEKRTLQQLQTYVGGYIQIVPHFIYCLHENVLYRGTCYANEEGLIKQLPTNLNAINMWFMNLMDKNKMPFDPSRVHLVGNVLFEAKGKS